MVSRRLLRCVLPEGPALVAAHGVRQTQPRRRFMPETRLQARSGARRARLREGAGYREPASWERGVSLSDHRACLWDQGKRRARCMRRGRPGRTGMSSGRSSLIPRPLSPLRRGKGRSRGATGAAATSDLTLSTCCCPPSGALACGLFFGRRFRDPGVRRVRMTCLPTRVR